MAILFGEPIGRIKINFSKKVRVSFFIAGDVSFHADAVGAEHFDVVGADATGLREDEQEEAT